MDLDNSRERDIPPSSRPRKGLWMLPRPQRERSRKETQPQFWEAGRRVLSFRNFWPRRRLLLGNGCVISSYLQGGGRDEKRSRFCHGEEGLLESSYPRGGRGQLESVGPAGPRRRVWGGRLEAHLLLQRSEREALLSIRSVRTAGAGRGGGRAGMGMAFLLQEGGRAECNSWGDPERGI